MRRSRRILPSSWLMALAAAVAACSASLAIGTVQDEEVVTVTMLGTSGGPQLDRRRANPSTLLQVGDDYYLIDCGIGTARRLAETGVSIDQIKAVFVTHLHPDHTMGLADLLADRRLASGNKIDLPPLEIYGPRGTVALSKSAGDYVETGFSVFSLQGVGKDRVKPIFTAHDVGPGEIFGNPSITLSAHENTHYVLMDEAIRSRHQSLSYRIATPQGSVVFSGDTGPDAGLADFGKGADLLIAEIVNLAENVAVLERGKFGVPENFRQKMIDHMTHQHLPGREVGLLASHMNAGAVILNHFGPVDVVPSVMSANIEDVRKEYSGDVIAAEDLDQFCITASDNGHARISICGRATNQALTN